MVDVVKTIDDGTIIEIIQGGDLTIVMPIQSGVEIEKLLFTQLQDTPNEYTGAAGKTVVVNATEDGLEFAKTYNSFISLDDTPNKYEGYSKQLVAVNADGTGLRFINYTVDEIDIEYFTQLADVPQAYTGKGGYLVAVSKLEDGLEFIEPDIIPDQQFVNPGSYKYPKIVVNKQGIITAIEEGKPFEFDPFPENQFLIGDGSSNPASFPLGTYRQYMSSDINGLPKWDYVSVLTKATNVIVQATEVSSEDTGTLSIDASSTNIDIRPTGNQSLTLGKGRNIILDGQIVIPATRYINALDGVRIDPNNGVVGITGVTAESYANRITDNDFITKKWFELNQPEQVTTYTKTETQTIMSSQIMFRTGARTVITEIHFEVLSPFNDEAAFHITDSLGRIIYDSEQCPVLDDNLTIFVNIPVYDDSYQLTVNVVGYQYGQGNIFASFFVEGDEN